VFFTRNTQNFFAAPSAIGKNMIFWRNIMIFHTKYPKKISRLPPLGAIFLSAPPPNLKSWNRPWLLHGYYIGTVKSCSEINVLHHWDK
jgi:hypothetical protein